MNLKITFMNSKIYLLEVCFLLLEEKTKALTSTSPSSSDDGSLDCAQQPERQKCEKNKEIQVEEIIDL